MRLISQYCAISIGLGEYQALETALHTCRLSTPRLFKLEDTFPYEAVRHFISFISTELNVNLKGGYTLFEFLTNHLEAMYGTVQPKFLLDEGIKEVINHNPHVLAVRPSFLSQGHP